MHAGATCNISIHDDTTTDNNCSANSNASTSKSELTFLCVCVLSPHPTNRRLLWRVFPLSNSVLFLPGANLIAGFLSAGGNLATRQSPRPHRKVEEEEEWWMVSHETRGFSPTSISGNLIGKEEGRPSIGFLHDRSIRFHFPGGGGG